MKIGTAKSVITPPVGTPLAGFSSRQPEPVGVLDELECNAIWIQQEEDTTNAVCIVTADIVNFSEEAVPRIRKEISSLCNIHSDNILLAASHTHSGPMSDPTLIACGEFIPEVYAQIEKKIIDSAVESSKNLSNAKMSIGKGKCEGCAINRRLPVNGNIEFMPYMQGIKDEEVMVICFKSEEDKQIKAVLFQYTCHPSNVGWMQFSADYPGAARRHIESELGNGAVAAFLPGCFGDIRTNCTYVGNTMWRKTIPEDIEYFGKALGSEVIRIVEDDLQETDSKLYAQIEYTKLNMAHEPDEEEVQQSLKSEYEIDREWAKIMQKKEYPMSVKFAAQRIDLSKNVRIVAMNAEMVCEYGLYLKNIEPDSFIIPLGYSNGYLGYIPTAKMLDEGGYESLGSYKYIPYPSEFSKDVESIVNDALDKLMR